MTRAAAFILMAVATSSVLAQQMPPCFLSMGDWGSTNRHVAAIGANMQAIIADPQSVGCSSVQLVLALGDNFYPSGVTSVDDPQWQRTFVGQFRSLPGFETMPVYPVVGDHDYDQLNPQMAPNHSKAQAQIDYYFKKDPYWYLPESNYTVRVTLGTNRTVLFVALDTEAIYTCLRLKKEWCFKKDQLAWFESVLSAADEDPTITAIVVMGHHALVCPLGGHYDPFIDDVLVPIGRKHRVSAFLTGHSHFLAWSSESDLGDTYGNGDMWYIINGAGRGAGAYPCWWHGLNFRVAKPINKLCFPAALNDEGAFMVHRVGESSFDHCVIAGMTGNITKCQTAPYRSRNSSSV